MRRIFYFFFSRLSVTRSFFSVHPVKRAFALIFHSSYSMVGILFSLLHVCAFSDFAVLLGLITSITFNIDMYCGAQMESYSSVLLPSMRSHFLSLFSLCSYNCILYVTCKGFYIMHCMYLYIYNT